jgi:hypothetical protein
MVESAYCVNVGCASIRLKTIDRKMGTEKSERRLTPAGFFCPHLSVLRSSVRTIMIVIAIVGSRVASHVASKS